MAACQATTAPASTQQLNPNSMPSTGHPGPQWISTTTIPSPTISITSSPAASATPVAGFSVQPVQAVVETVTPRPAPSPTPTPLPSPSLAPTRDSRPDPRLWSEWAVVPTVSARAKEIYQRGLKLGNDPRSFSTIGDCQSEPPVFMGIYDSDRFWLGDGYEYLREAVTYFQGNFTRQNATVRDGLSVASVFSPLWADKKLCQPGETPLDCEFRLHKPSIVFINLGTNWKGGDGVTHDPYLRKIVEYVIERGAVPVLSTKADNLEGDHSINKGIVRTAYEFDVPLFNFWLSTRDLPGKGIDGTREGGYLTTEAWSRRNFVALQTLYAVWNGLKTGTPRTNP